MRDNVISYCARVAMSPDATDPEAGVRAEEDRAAMQRTVDERLDPYSARYFPRPLRTEALFQVLRNEAGVEKIVRERTWTAVEERCGKSGMTAAEAYMVWQRRQSSAPEREPG
jgi:hypothetical protein